MRRDLGAVRAAARRIATPRRARGAAVTRAELVPAYLEAEAAAPHAWIALMGPAVELAKAVAGTEFVPRAMRDNVAAIAAAILYGDEIGLGPMQSLARGYR